MIIRKVTIDDWKILLSWRNDIITRKNSHNMELIKEESHKKWMLSILKNINRKLFIAIENEKAVGTVRADFEEKTKSYELSWTISPDFRGKGIGKKMLKLICINLNAKVKAEIKKENIASIKIAEFAGLKFKKNIKGVLHYSN